MDQDFQKLSEYMSLYFDGELSGDEAKAFEAHIKEQGFAQEYAEYSKVLEDTRSLPGLKLPQGLHERVIQALHAESRPIEFIKKPQEERKKNFRLSCPKNIKAYTAAAAVLMAFTAALVGLLGLFENIAPPPIPSEVALSTLIVQDNSVLGDIFITTHEISLQVQNLNYALNAIYMLDGHTLSASIYSHNGTPRNAQVLLSADGLGHVLENLRALGQVISETSASRRITQEMMYLNSALHALGAEEYRLSALVSESSPADSAIIGQILTQNMQASIGLQQRLASYHLESQNPHVTIYLAENTEQASHLGWQLLTNISRSNIFVLRALRNLLLGIAWLTPIIAYSALFIAIIRTAVRLQIKKINQNNPNE